ncbi:MAG TPA: recombination protein O N-terminal domain-containing protein [Candidatus Paceibacterota bacterium]|nr:recombination protein O N-terminal domain-containing protein [Candidatus Paceibacterota bacterium]
MRHKYDTRGIVLARHPAGEANALVAVLTPELGLVRARAQGVRRSGAKLAPALATLAESDLILVRGKDTWRVAGAILAENWFRRLTAPAPRARAARVSHLLLRLVAGEERDLALFPVVAGFLNALVTLPEDAHDAAEVLVALRIMKALGLDAGDIPGETSSFAPEFLDAVARERAAYVARVNHGIAASGL